MHDDEWAERVWRDFDNAGRIFDSAAWADLDVPDRHPARTGCLRGLLAASVLVAVLGCGAALGRQGQPSPVTRFVQVDPPSATVDIRP